MRGSTLFFSILLVALLGLPNKALPQSQQLSFGIDGVQGVPDTATFGDVINIEFWLINTTHYPTTINGLLEITFSTDSTGSLTSGAQSSFIPHTVLLEYQDSIKIDFTETIDNRFASGDNITVVWPKIVNDFPTTSEFSIGKIYVMGFHSNDETIESSFQIYPNPANDYLSITSTSMTFANLSIYNAIGEKIKILPNHFFSQPLFLGELQQGVYFLEIQHLNKDNTQAEKIRFLKN